MRLSLPTQRCTCSAIIFNPDIYVVLFRRGPPSHLSAHNSTTPGRTGNPQKHAKSEQKVGNSWKEGKGCNRWSLSLRHHPPQFPSFPPRRHSPPHETSANILQSFFFTPTTRHFLFSYEGEGISAPHASHLWAGQTITGLLAVCLRGSLTSRGPFYVPSIH